MFAITGAASIVLLASIGTPGKRQTEIIDRHTGRKVISVHTVADALFAARDSGHAQHARSRFAAERHKFKVTAVLDRLDAILASELSNDLEAPPEAHAHAAVIAAEQERARQLRAQLDESLPDKLPRATLLSLLDDLEADTTIAASTEEFFAPLARWRSDRASEPHRPDEWAARRLRKLEESKDPPTEADFLELVDAFRSQNRVRAQRRWLLRGFGALPHSHEIRERLVRTYLAHGRTQEAFLIIGTALRDEPDNMELWNYRAQIAGWLTLPKLELEARVRLLAELDNTEARERIITLCRYVGKPELAIPHAIHVAQDSENPAIRERPSRLALAAGRVDLALGFLAAEAERTHKHKFWREKIIEYAWQDLRVDRVIAELKFLRARYPDDGYDGQLESVYRRRNMAAELVELLDARLTGNDNPELEQEVIGLYTSLGNTKRVRELLERRLRRIQDPARFFEALPSFIRLKLTLFPTAERLIASDRFTAPQMVIALDALTPHFADEGFRKLALAAARRWPSEPAARELLITDADQRADDAARADAAMALSRANPDDPVYLKAWLERASWAGNASSEAEARTLWMKHNPDDKENETKLAELYDILERPDDALVLWRRLAAREGAASDAHLKVIEALFAADRVEEAVAALEERAALPNASLEDRLRVAEQLFAKSYFDRSLHFFTVVLDEEPQHLVALLRMGQIRSWTNDPRGAIPFFEERLALSDEDAAEVQYYLGEALWSVRETEKGRRLHELSLADLLPRTDRTVSQDVMVAKMLARLGRVDEALPIFERTIELLPDDVNLVLDFADSMIAVQRIERARALVDRAKSMKPKSARVMRLDGSLLLREKRPAEAARVLRVAFERHGPEAGTESERGLANELSGDWIAATDAYERSLQLQPGNVDVARSLQTLADQLAEFIHGELAFRRAGDDTVFSLRAIGSKQLSKRVRGAVELGFRSYEGQSSLGMVDDTLMLVNVAAFFRYEGSDTLSVGISGFPGADGDLPIGAWAGWHLLRRDPYQAFNAVAFANLLFDDPAAAVTLGGRRTGITVDYQRDLGRRGWVSAAATFEALSLDAVNARDNRVDALASIGWRFHEGLTRLAPPISISRPELPGLTGMSLLEDPAHTPGPLLAAWVSLQAIRLQDNTLAPFIPIGDKFYYLALGGRADFHLARGWGAGAEVSLGTELNAGEFFFNVRGGATWRPSHRIELTATVGVGTTQGRDQDSTSVDGRIGFTVRW